MYPGLLVLMWVLRVVWLDMVYSYGCSCGLKHNETGMLTLQKQCPLFGHLHTDWLPGCPCSKELRCKSEHTNSLKHTQYAHVFVRMYVGTTAMCIAVIPGHSLAWQC